MAHSFNVPMTHNFPAMELNKSKPNEWGAGLSGSDLLPWLQGAGLWGRQGQAQAGKLSNGGEDQWDSEAQNNCFVE